MKQKDTYAKRALIMIVGSIVFGMGIGFCNAADLGMDPMSVFSDGIHQTISITLGQANALLSIVEIAIAFVLNRKNVSLITLATIFTVSIGIDLVGLFHISNLTMLLRVVFMVMGFLIYTFGIAITQNSGIGYSGYDSFIFSLGTLFHTESYHLLRWGTDGLFLILGFLLGGTIGICTALVLIAAGKVTEWWLKQIEGFRSRIHA